MIVEKALELGGMLVGLGAEMKPHFSGSSGTASDGQRIRSGSQSRKCSSL